MRIEPCVHGATDGQHFVFLGLLHEQLFQFLQLLGIFGREIVHQRVIAASIEQLPLILHGIPVGKVRHRSHPRCPGPKRTGHPSFVINTTAAHDVEVLGFFHLWGICRIESAGKAHPVKGILLVAIDHLGWRNFEKIIDGRHHVVDVEELRARASCPA